LEAIKVALGAKNYSDGLPFERYEALLLLNYLFKSQKTNFLIFSLKKNKKSETNFPVKFENKTKKQCQSKKVFFPDWKKTKN
jgi:hypothetical protein